MTGAEFETYAQKEMKSKQNEIFEIYNFNEEEKAKFENAILEYDYLDNEGIYWQSKEDLITSCYGEKVDNRLAKGLAEYIRKLNEVYIGNTFFNTYNNINKVVNEILEN